MKKKKDTLATYLRNFVFGVEDSLVSTVGLLSGVAAAGLPKEDIFLTGIILIFVEAFSMGVGSYLSEESAEEFTKRKYSISIPGALIMFFSYFASGFIPLFPYLVFPVAWAFYISIVFSLTALFLLGTVSALMYKTTIVVVRSSGADQKTNIFKRGLKMLVVGGMAIAVGVLVGKFVNR